MRLKAQPYNKNLHRFQKELNYKSFENRLAVIKDLHRKAKNKQLQESIAYKQCQKCNNQFKLHLPRQVLCDNCSNLQTSKNIQQLSKALLKITKKQFRDTPFTIQDVFLLLQGKHPKEHISQVLRVWIQQKEVNVQDGGYRKAHTYKFLYIL